MTSGETFAILFLLIGVASYLSLAFLLKVEHDDFHEEWVKDGRPSGAPVWFPMKEMSTRPFSIHPSYPWFRGLIWLFRTPEWTKQSARAHTLLLVYRILFLGFFFLLGFIVFVSAAQSKAA